LSELSICLFFSFTVSAENHEKKDVPKVDEFAPPSSGIDLEFETEGEYMYSKPSIKKALKCVQGVFLFLPCKIFVDIV
jgi:hypothetical protein